MIKKVSIEKLAETYAIGITTLYTWNSRKATALKARLKLPTKANPKGLNDKEIEEVVRKTRLQLEHLKLGYLVSANGYDLKSFLKTIDENEKLKKQVSIMTKEINEFIDAVEGNDKK